MSLRLNTEIVIQQVPNDAFPDREKVFIIDFVQDGEIVSSWQNLTDTATITLPRSIYVQRGDGELENWTDKDIATNTEGSTEGPLFMRGDKITISLGYFVDDMQGGEDGSNAKIQEFKGFISGVRNKLPITISCEDNMWKLKQIPVKNKKWLAKYYSVKKMLEEMLSDTDFSVDDGGTDVSVGDFLTYNESVSNVLSRLKEAGLYSFFRGDTLRCSSIVYYPQDRQDEVFRFQENIINDNMLYTRKEDVNVCVKAYSMLIKEQEGKFNKTGKTKTQRERLEVIVGRIKGTGEIGKVKEATGDLFTFPVPGATTEEELVERGKEYLLKLYYTGFRGDFTTFGFPSMKHGDGAIIQNAKIPEQNGTYLIKQVRKRWGMGIGYRQVISLHLRIDSGSTQSNTNAGA